MSPRPVLRAALGRLLASLVAVSLATVSLVAITPTAGQAQLAAASASTLALSGNHAALATGFGALAVNPAGIGAGPRRFGIAILPLQIRGALEPVTLDDLARADGERLSAQTKERWLRAVEAAGGEAGRAGLELSGVALAWGPVGVQISTVGSADAQLPPDVVQAMLYGNGGRTGQPADLSLADAGMSGLAATTVAAGVGFPVGSSVSVGALMKYTQGHAVVYGRTVSGIIAADPIRADVDFGIISSCIDGVVCEKDYENGGSGVGLDLGVRWNTGGMTVAAAAQNVFNTFAWDPSKLAYRPGIVRIRESSGTADFTERPVSEAPANLRAQLDGLEFQPRLRLGLAVPVRSSITVTGEVQGRTGSEAIGVQGSRWHVGAGGEFRGRVVEGRLGLAVVEGGGQAGAGLALILGPVNLALAGGFRRADGRTSTLGQFVLSLGDR